MMNLKPEELVKALRHCSNDYPCKRNERGH